ncbi:endonuclease V [Pedobacter miscanthi]|uniref:endonuclease V n=1 Tax=Pedobacter miscanthi TaxID=2259170 RepID=UPI00292D1AA7|nr:endonuclease V [Pedobacter miscanthi]
MILAFDTFYFEDKAKTICLSFAEWKSDRETTIYSDIVVGIEDYISGEFYKRELPCILNLIAKIDLTNVEFIIVDGFVYLDDDKKLGLGGHLYEKLGQKIPVIGVAKSDFAAIHNNKKAVLRGESKKPLFLTSIGIDLQEASNFIKAMHGDFRIPKLLKDLDILTKNV